MGGRGRALSKRLRVSFAAVVYSMHLRRSPLAVEYHGALFPEAMGGGLINLTASLGPPPIPIGTHQGAIICRLRSSDKEQGVHGAHRGPSALFVLRCRALDAHLLLVLN